MAFTKLNEGGLDCLQEPGITDDLERTYIRGVNHQITCVHEFKTSAEDGFRFAHPPTNRQECQRRTASVYLFENEEQRELIRQHLIIVKGIVKQFRFTYLCFFQIAELGPKIWDTGTSKNPQHRSLIQPDDFHIGQLKISNVTPSSNF